MDLTKLSPSVQSQLRSDMMIFNISRCVTELVENAIDAKATCIAVKMDLTKFQIQIVDNGSGVSKEHLDLIGTRYWSTKYSKQYSKPYDHRGEFLASIKNSCSRLMIVSRAVGDEVTYCKVFDESMTGTVVEALHQRASKGTTVIINNFFGNLPVRQKIIVPAVEIRNTKRCIQGISLMYPSILFILKDDAKNVEILRISRTSSTLRKFRVLFPQAIDHHSSMIKVVANVRNVSMRAMICRKTHNNRDLQFVFVNKRFMIESGIRSMLNELLSKKGFFEVVSENTEDLLQPGQQQQQRQKSALSKEQPKFAIFILNICCCLDEYRVMFLPDKRQVDFKDKMKIKHCLMKLVDTFWEQGLFEDSSVQQRTVVSLPEKTKSTFMPRLLFEKMNQIRTLRGAPASRKVIAAEVGLTEEKNVEISRSIEADEASSCEMSEELHGNTPPNLLAPLMPHDNLASSPTISEPYKQFDSCPKGRKKSKQNKPYADNDDGAELAHQPALIATFSTPSCISPPVKPILSMIGFLNRLNPQHNADKSISSILNTSKIHEKLREIEISSCTSKSLCATKSSCDKHSTPSCCIQTNSNIRLYDAKRKFHLQKKKTSGRACELESLRKIKLKEKECPKLENLKHASKKRTVLKEPILQIDNNLYEPKIQPSQFMVNPKLESQTYSQEIRFNLHNQSKEYLDLSAPVTSLNPIEQVQILKASLNVDSRNEYEAPITNQKQCRTKSVQSLAPKQNFGIVSETKQSNNINNKAPAVADLIYALNMKTFVEPEISKNLSKMFHSEFNVVSRETSLGSPEIFTTKRDVSQYLWSTSKMVSYDENCFSKNVCVENNWFSGARSSFDQVLKQQEKSRTEKSCKISQCICSCHKMTKLSTNSSTGLTTLISNFQNKFASMNESSAPATQISLPLFSSRTTEDQTAVQYFPSAPNLFPASSSNVMYGSNSAKTHSLGIFSELAEFYSVARTGDTTRQLRTENSDVQNGAEIQPFFSESIDKKLPNKMTHDNFSLLAQSIDKCFLRGNAAEVSSNHLVMPCRNVGEDFRLTNTSKRISAECENKISDKLTPCEFGPDDPTQLVDNSYETDSDDFSSGSTPRFHDPTHLADESFSIDSEDIPSNSPQAYTLSQLANDSFSANLENSWVGNTPGSKFLPRLSRNWFSVEPEKSELAKPKLLSTNDSTKLGDFFSMGLENSKVSDSDPAEAHELIQFTSDSFSTNLENSNIRHIGGNNLSQLANDSLTVDSENSKIDNIAAAINPTKLANDSVGLDQTTCLTFGPTSCTSIKESTHEKISHENDLLAEKMSYRRNSKFLGTASVFDIPNGILEVQGTKSKPISFDKSQKIDFLEFAKPCSMKDHFTFDDYGNSCLRIFPIMKGIIDSKDVDFKLDYGNFPEDLNCSIVFSKMDLKSVQFLAQLENKFLLSSLVMEDSQDQIIVMFDQHAVDERIRVERLSKEYINEKGIWRSVPVNDTICICVSRCEISVILDFREDFCNKGIDFDFTDVEENSDDQFTIKVIRVPLCLHNRASREPTKTNIVTCLKELTESLIKELTHILIRTRGISRSATPQILQNIINSEACRGAVKFGEQLSSDICSTLLQSLWSCNMPFQCAHGRPLLAPLANVAKLAHIGMQKFPKKSFAELKIQLLQNV